MMRLALFLILSTATFVRVYGLGGPSFWVDEVYSAMVVESFSKMWASDVHPPLYYALLYLWASFSTTDYWLRLLSAVLGVLTVAMTYVVGRIVFNTPAALWAAAFLAIMPIHVEYSQEARPYALLTFLFATGVWAVFLVEGRRPLSPWLLYVVSSLLMCYSHGIGFVFWLGLTIGLAAHLYFKHSTKAPWIAFGLANALILLLFSPWFSLLKSSYVGGKYVKSSSSLLTPFAIPLYSFAFGQIPPLSAVLAKFVRIDSPPTTINWILVLPVICLLAIAAMTPARTRRCSIVLFLTLAAPIAILFTVSITAQPMLIPRTALPSVVPLVLLLGLGVAAFSPRRIVPIVCLVLVVAELGIGLFYYHRYRPYGKEAWRETSVLLQQHVRAADCVVVFGWLANQSLRRYDPSSRLERLCIVAGGRYGVLTGDGLTSPSTQVVLKPGQTIWIVERITRTRPTKREMVRTWATCIEELDFGDVQVTRLSIPLEATPTLTCPPTLKSQAGPRASS